MNTDDWSTPATEYYVLDLAGLPAEEPYRPETTAWAEQVDWSAVNDLAIELVYATRGEVDMAAVERVSRQLESGSEAQALESLFYYPIVATVAQVSNGIHRLAAMLAQGNEQTVGSRLVEAQTEDGVGG